MIEIMKSMLAIIMIDWPPSWLHISCIGEMTNEPFEMIKWINPNQNIIRTELQIGKLRRLTETRFSAIKRVKVCHMVFWSHIRNQEKSRISWAPNRNSKKNMVYTLVPESRGPDLRRFYDVCFTKIDIWNTFV